MVLKEAKAGCSLRAGGGGCVCCVCEVQPESCTWCLCVFCVSTFGSRQQLPLGPAAGAGVAAGRGDT